MQYIIRKMRANPNFGVHPIDYICLHITRKEGFFMKLFDPNGPVSRFLSRVGDLILLNLICIVCCLPFFTAGASVTAMHYVLLRMRRGDECGIVRDFFHSFRQNLKQGILLHLILTVVTAVLALDLYILWTLWEYEIFYKIIFIGTAVLALWYLGISVFIYPLLAQFNNTIWGFLKDARFISLKYKSHAIAIILVTFAPWITGLYVPYLLEWLIFFYLLIGVALIPYLLCPYYITIFDKYITPPENQE